MTVNTRARPVITLTTDFGDADAYVAAMKGVILEMAPDAGIVDITHAVPPQGVRAAAFHIACAAPYFPEGTIHVVVVDPGVGGARRPVAVRTAQAVFVAPDNGVLTRVLAGSPPELAVHLNRPEFWRRAVSSTFHGRDVFAPVAARIALGASIDALGTPVHDLLRLDLPEAASAADGTITGAVQHIDHFGNCVTDIPGEWVSDPIAHEVQVGMQQLHGVKVTYCDAAVGQPLALVGSHGYLEIAVRDGNAARAMSLRMGDRVTVRLGSDPRPGERG